jgi:cell division septation protein DedD
MGGGPGDYSDDNAEAGAYEQGEYDYEEDPGDPGNPGNDYQDDGAATSKPRKTIKVAAAAVLGLAVFGSAAALGYHTMFKDKRLGPPPVIRADNSPTKVVPAGVGGVGGVAGVGGEASPKINERLGDGSQERLVRREEDPVVLRDPPRGLNANPGMALAGIGGPAPAASAPSTVPVAAPPAGAGGAADEAPPPKRVRTVSIRVDQGAPGAAAPPSRSASATRVAAAAPAAGAAPLALTPQAVGAAQATAAVEPSQSGPARARPSQPAESTGFVVQLSAQKSESEAQAAFRSMQTRYAVLNGRQPLIRRKERADHGVVYAALVGPFGTRDEAIQLCESLKMAGGDCFVQKN